MTKTVSKIVGVSRYKQRACLQAINSQSFNFTVNGYTEINFCLCHSLSFKLETNISSVPPWEHCFTKPKRENLSSLCYCFALLAVPKETPDFFRRTNQGHCRKKIHTHTQMKTFQVVKLSLLKRRNQKRHLRYQNHSFCLNLTVLLYRGFFPRV